LCAADQVIAASRCVGGAPVNGQTHEGELVGARNLGGLWLGELSDANED